VSARLNWIGLVTDADDVMVMRPDAGLSSLTEVRAREFTLGVPGATSSPALTIGAMNSVL